MNRAWIIAALAVGLASGTVKAQTPSAKGPMDDSLFAAAAAGSGMAEVALSKIAVERGGCDAVKAFAKQMVEDHTAANKELMALAAQKKIALPATLPVAAQAEAVSLSGLSGEDFDKCYVSNQLAAHICAVGLFTAEAERGQDPDVKALAAKLLPKLKEHKHHAMELHKEMESK